MTKISFSSAVKNELCELKFKEGEAVAELAAMILFGENLQSSDILIKTDRAPVAARIQAALKKTTHEEVPIDILKGKRSFSIKLNRSLLEKCGVYLSDDGEIALDEDVYESAAQKRAFLRGAFLISGTITDPLKGYSCELFTYNENMAYLSSEMLEEFGIRANTVKRNSYSVTYLKDKNSVGDFLNIIGAHKQMMEFIETQIEKDINNRNNREAICIAANLDKTIAASARQCDAIMKLQKSIRWEKLDDATKELAKLRLDFFDLPLSAIGQKMNPVMTKSSVNRRMNKLIELAEEL